MDKPSYTARRSLLNLIMGGLVMGGTFGASPASFRPARAEAVAAPDGLSPPENAEIAAVLDGETLALASGETLRLAGIEAPQAALAPDDAAMRRLAATATGALAALVASRNVTLRQDAGKRDRHGRRLAQAFNGDGVWLQAALVGDGHARVHGDGRNRLGLRALLRLEVAARDARRGLWRHPAFAIRAADDPELGRLAGSFQIVEGRVFAAAAVKGTGFINFGADRRTDLTLVLEDPALDLGGPTVIDLAWLTSKPIRCRGWLDLHDGPSIDIGQPEQIEVLEG